MKKIVIFTLAILLLTSSSFSFAKTSVKTSVKTSYLSDIRFAYAGKQDKITIYAGNYKGYKVFYIPGPDRIIVDIPGNTVTCRRPQPVPASGSVLKGIRYSQFTKTDARVVLDVKGKPTWKVEEKSGALTITLTNPAPPAATASTNPTGASRGDVSRPDGQTQTPPTSAPGSDPSQDPASGTPTGNPQDPASGASTGNTQNPASGASTGNTQNPASGASTGNPQDPTSGTSTGNTQNPASGASTGNSQNQTSDVTTGTQNPAVPAPALRRLTFSLSPDSEKIIIPGGDHAGYSVTRFSNPDRLSVNIPNLAVPSDQEVVIVGGNLINHTRSAQIDPTTAQLAIYTNGQASYSVYSSQDQLVLELDSPKTRNIVYNNDGSRTYFTLKGAKLTEVIPGSSSSGSTDNTQAESAGLKKLYTGGLDATGKQYTITFPSSLGDFDPGTVQINDGIIDSITISKDGQNTSITFVSKYALAYEVVADQAANDTDVNILKPSNPADRLVVIDAGHGGTDPGAQYSGVKEKDLNLKIALKLNEILKSKGIKTYMTREDDTFVPLKDRANIANNLNAALFISVHNNAFNKSENGTETLYYPGDSGKQFANIVQAAMVKALGTFDRGIVQRPNLVVLNTTKMPAVIAEVAFVTNDSDRAKLLDDNFLNTAAAALADSVISELGI